MAIITPGPLISAISGTIGGINFVTTKSGLIARRPIRRADQATALQYHQRNRVAYCTRLWASLSTTKLAGWQAAAAALVRYDRLGRPHHLSPFTAFLWCNLGAWTASTGDITDAPDPYRTHSLDYLSIVGDTTTSAITVTKESILSGTWYECFWGSLSRRQVHTFYPHNWTLLLVQAGSSPTINLWSTWANYLPTPIVGQRIAIRYVRIANGFFPSSPQIATGNTIAS